MWTYHWKSYYWRNCQSSWCSIYSRQVIEATWSYLFKICNNCRQHSIKLTFELSWLALFVLDLSTVLFLEFTWNLFWHLPISHQRHEAPILFPLHMQPVVWYYWTTYRFVRWGGNIQISSNKQIEFLDHVCFTFLD